MFGDLITSIWRVNIALAGFACFMGLAIFGYALAQNLTGRKKARHLKKIKKILYSLSGSSGHGATDSPSLTALQHISAGLFLDIVLNRQRHTVFFNSAEQEFLKHCYFTPDNLLRLKKIAARPLFKWRRIEALLALGYAEDVLSFESLKKALKNPNPEISYFAAISLGQNKHPDSARALTGFLRTARAPRYKIASLLAQFPPEIAPEMILLAQDQHPDVRFWGLRILSAMKNPSYFETLESLLEDSSPETRAAACQYFGSTRHQPIAEKIKFRLKDEDWNVRMQALIALEKIRESNCVADALCLIKDNSWRVLDRLKKVLADHIEAALPHLEQLFLGNDPLSKKIAVEIIGRSGYAPKLFDDLLSGADQKKRALLIMKSLLENGAFETLESVLMECDVPRRKQILATLGALDAPLAGKFEFMLNLEPKAQ